MIRLQFVPLVVLISSASGPTEEASQKLVSSAQLTQPTCFQEQKLPNAMWRKSPDCQKRALIIIFVLMLLSECPDRQHHTYSRLHLGPAKQQLKCLVKY